MKQLKISMERSKTWRKKGAGKGKGVREKERAVGVIKRIYENPGWTKTNTETAGVKATIVTICSRDRMAMVVEMILVLVGVALRPRMIELRMLLVGVALRPRKMMVLLQSRGVI